VTDDEARAALGAGPVELDAVVDIHILRVLDACRGCVSQAAFLLGIRRQSLQRKLKRISLERRDPR